MEGRDQHLAGAVVNMLEYIAEDVEMMLEEYLERLETQEGDFTEWEVGFLESIEDFVDELIVSEAQEEKLREIYLRVMKDGYR